MEKIMQPATNIRTFAVRSVSYDSEYSNNERIQIIRARGGPVQYLRADGWRKMLKDFGQPEALDKFEECLKFWRDNREGANESGRPIDRPSHEKFRTQGFTLTFPKGQSSDKIFRRVQLEAECGRPLIDVSFEEYCQRIYQSLAALKTPAFEPHEYFPDRYGRRFTRYTQAELLENIQKCTEKRVAFSPANPEDFGNNQVYGEADYLELSVGDETKLLLFSPGGDDPVAIFDKRTATESSSSSSIERP
jgi:hypothetical protein